LVKDRDWTNIDNAMENFAYFKSRSIGQYLPALETINMSGTFRIVDKDSRLRFQILHALRQSDMKQIMQFILVAYGHLNNNSDQGILEWLGAAREWIVRGFTELTTDTAHRRWGRRR
jgi:uncharacterized protein (TIGR04255 family)